MKASVPARLPASGFARRLPGLLALCLCTLTAQAAAPLKVLFLGDNGIHKPATRLRELAPDMISRGIQLVYTEDVTALNLENLRRYDALLVYANITSISPAQDQALFDYVSQGGGLVALHSASASFGNSDRLIALMGARFKSHGTGVLKTRIAAPNNPVMQGFAGFESWDESYVHDRQNESGRTVLEYRDDEPWTWIRTEGKGRVFYTAWGHDERTWTNPGFHDLVERGIRYAAGQSLPASLSKTPAVTPFEYVDQQVPFYQTGAGTNPGGANDWPKMQKPLTAAQSMEHMVVPAGFEVQLFASEPDIKKPISMAWDERGRLWILETVDYPNRLLTPGEPGNDRILICEDTNHDGKADKFTVFAEGLNVPTSLTFARGGVIVQQMPNTLFLKDTDGDGKADLREVLITGWGRRDTHAGPSNLQYGFDNWIWGMVGYSGFAGTVGGKESRVSQGFYRFKQDGSAFEFLRSTNNNTWGLGFNEAGVAFGSTANNVPSVYMPIPDRYYAPAGLTPATLASIADTSRYLPITTKVREVDVFWGYTAGAGHAVYTARSYPKEYWNRIAFVNEPTGHLVGEFMLDADGADFHSKNPTNLLSSDDEWTAPIMSEVGPDGSVWVIDWYNYIVQHNPTPTGYQTGAGAAYENELRDKRHGRIYRIVWKAGTPSQQPNLANATPAQLVQALTNDNLFWRRTAQRLLVERARKDVVPALIALTKDTHMDEIGQNPGALHALWTLQGLQAIDTDATALAAATDALRHPSASVRRNAAAVLPRTAATAAAISAAGLLKDPDSQVRLAAMLALSESPDSPAAAQGLHDMLATPRLTLDRWSADAAKMAATGQSRSFLAAVTPEEMAGARAAQAQAMQSVLSSASFAARGSALPPGWDLTRTAGEADAAPADIARTGSRSLRLTLRGEGAGASVARQMTVKRNYHYELTGWIRTEGLPAAPAAAAGARAGGGGGGRGGAPAGAQVSLTANLITPVAAMNLALAPLSTAAAAARTALAEASFAEPKNAADLRNKAAALMQADQTLALAQATQFEKLQASANRLPADQVVALAAGGGAGRGGRGATPAVVRGSSDWTQVRTTFDSTGVEEVQVVFALSLGPTGTTNGTAWLDEVSLNELGPVDDTASDPFNTTILHVANKAGLTMKLPALPGNAADANALVLNLGTMPDLMKYDHPELTAKAGQRVRLVFKNNDHMQHNVLILQPGTIEAVGLLADAMLTDTTALARNYVPASANVLFNLPLVNPGETSELVFTAPSTPGRYPMVCTFPGHWRIMQGTLIVTP